MSLPPQLYSRSSGASARFTVVSETCGVGAPTVESLPARWYRAAVGIKGRPLAELFRIGECPPDLLRRMAQLADEKQRPGHLLADLGAAGAPGEYGSRLLIAFSLSLETLAHAVEVPFESVDVRRPIARNGANQASISISGSGLIRYRRRWASTRASDPPRVKGEDAWIPKVGASGVALDLPPTVPRRPAG